jgi:hypothetical protein
MSVVRSAAIAAIRAACARATFDAGSTITHTSPAAANSRDERRVRQAAAAAMPAAIALDGVMSCRSRTYDQAESVKKSVNVSSRQPSALQLIASNSIAHAPAASSPTTGPNAAAPSR